MNNMKISCLFLDIGGVLLSNGWGHEFRQLAIKHFNIDGMEERHRLIYITYEEGRISLDEYLDRTVFYKSRDFTRTELLNFIYSLSTADTDMIDFIRKIKLQYGLKIIAVSNESREINEYRINTFKLNEIFDFYVSSCYVNVRKPDPKIFQIALDGAQVPANEIVYIDDKQMFIDIAKDLGINGICHTDYLSTAKALAEFGLTINQ
jgi:putative hydrolase of the HAD superfamily